MEKVRKNQASGIGRNCTSSRRKTLTVKRTKILYGYLVAVTGFDQRGTLNLILMNR